jgi:protein MpaA
MKETTPINPTKVEAKSDKKNDSNELKANPVSTKPLQVDSNKIDVAKVIKTIKNPMPKFSRKKFFRTKAKNITPAVKKYCKKVDKRFLHWGWGRSYCDHFNWHHVRNSVNGDPLMWVSYGDEVAHKKEHKDTTVIFCGVHGDEITPIKFCFDILYELELVKAGVIPAKEEYRNKMIIVSPITNPDSFFKKRATRTNARGIDINRNFPTKDWYKDALRLWKHRYGKAKRRYPGKAPMTEPEVVYQVNLIRRYKADKIISVHAPLTLLDYDGPEHHHHQHDKSVGIRANQLLIQMSKKASGYKIKNYPFFPGSLGNWAGNERGIPTYTLELPTADNRRHKEYWALFKDAIHSAISSDFRKDINVASKAEPEEDEKI